MDRTDHGGIKKVCFKVSEEDQEDSGHDTMSYRDSYRWERPRGSRGVWCRRPGAQRTLPRKQGLGLGLERVVLGVLIPALPPLCSECNSNRDSVLSYTSVRSNSSYLGSDEMGSGEYRGSCPKGGGPAVGFSFVYLISLSFAPCHILFCCLTCSLGVVSFPSRVQQMLVEPLVRSSG